MKISLIISTYNWPKALHLCLMSIVNQTKMPDEVIVADDGSSDDTRQLVERMAASFPCRLKHVWHEDKGFRLSAIRNKAVRDYCTGDYLIFIDGDIIVERHFVEDHAKMARPGYFVIGSRTKLKSSYTKRVIDNQITKLKFYNGGVRRKENGLHIPFLWVLTKYLYHSKRFYGRGANMAMYMRDFAEVNGFDEDMVGYGSEDFDIFNRLYNIGLKRNYAKFMAIEYHLYHPKSDFTPANSAILYGNLSRKRCCNGLRLIAHE